MARLVGYIALENPISDGIETKKILEQMISSHGEIGKYSQKMEGYFIDGNRYGIALCSSTPVDKNAIANKENLIFAINGDFQHASGGVAKSVEEIADIWLDNPVDFLSNQVGSAAGILIDRTRTAATIFRDRFGSRTLYYSHKGKNLYFASEPKAILAVASDVHELNETMFSRFMTMNYRMWFGRGETFFNGISELPLAHFMCFSLKGCSVSRYWSPPDRVMPDNVPDEVYIKKFKDLLYFSVSESLKDTKKPLFFVSGGLDAPVIAAIANKILEERVDCISAIFPEHPDCDESKYVTDLTRVIGKAVHLEKVTPEQFLEEYNFLLERHDQPLLSPVYVITHRMLRYAAANGYDKIFGGGGGDIVTQGCLEYQPYLFADYDVLSARSGNEALEAWQRVVGPYLRYWPSNPTKMRTMIKLLTDPNICGKIFHNPDWISVDPSYLGSNLQTLEIKPPTISVQYSTYRQSRIAEELFRQAIATHFVEEVNLASFPLNGKDPFFNLDLIEFGFTLPLKMLTRDGWTKYITREAMKDILPESLRMRPDKTGLAVPIDSWFRSGCLAEALTLEMKKNIFTDTGLFNCTLIQRAFQQHRSGQASHGWLLWKLFAFLKWSERWI